MRYDAEVKPLRKLSAFAEMNNALRTTRSTGELPLEPETAEVRAGDDSSSRAPS